jgi:hypothetical protein
LQLGRQDVTHWLLALQTSPVAQVPQLPWQPSLPHCFPVQLGAQTHWLLALQTSPFAHVPQLPWQPSLPHWFPVQLGVHVVEPHGVGDDQGWPEPAGPLFVSGSAP